MLGQLRYVHTDHIYFVVFCFRARCLLLTVFPPIKPTRPRIGSDRIYDRGLAERVRINPKIMENPYWFLPVCDDSHDAILWMPVGRGNPSSERCALHRGWRMCDETSLHGSHVDGYGVDGAGKIVWKHRHWWCKNAACPKCFVYGWAVRRANHIEQRLNVFKIFYGEIDHLTISIPARDYDLPYEVVRKKAMDAALNRGVLGGCMIIHRYRISRKHRCLERGIHFHIIGFIRGGFDRCRDCNHERGDCASCDGFKGREVRGYKQDGYLVKVLGKRKTIWGTAFYQCHHASMKVGVRRFQIVTWFGACGCAKRTGSKVSDRGVTKCPVCERPMKDKVRMSTAHVATDIADRGYQRWFFEVPYSEDGSPNYAGTGCGDERARKGGDKFG